MDLQEAKSLMAAVKEFEDWDAERFPYEKADAALALASTLRGYIEDEAELGGWYAELEKAIGEEEPETGIREPDGDLCVGRWRVHLVQEGERYGADGSLIYGETVGKGYPYIGQTINDCQVYGHGLPLVEFYDMSEDPERFPGGQFVTRYYMSTLLGMDSVGKSIGDMHMLSLDGGVPAWTVEGSDLQEVYRWLCDARDKLQPEGAACDKQAPSLAELAAQTRAAAQQLGANGSHDNHEPDTR